MTTETIRTLSGTSVFAGFGAELARALEAIADGWRAARDWDRLTANRAGMTSQQAAREIFTRNFA